MSKVNFPKRGEVYWVKLDPTVGSEIAKTRPALIISNNIGNEFSERVIVAPITSSTKKAYPFEVEAEINGKPAKIVLDQIRTLDKSRIGSKIVSLDSKIISQVDKAIKIALSLA